MLCQSLEVQIMYINFWYKSYKESKETKVISIIGELFNVIEKINDELSIIY